MTKQAFSWLASSATPMIVVAAAALAACGGDTTAPRATVPLPRYVTLTGTADTTEPDGTRVECSLNLLFDFGEGASGAAMPIGLVGGDVSRKVLAPDESGIAFWADVGGHVAPRFVAADSVEYDWQENAPSPVRFWHALARFAGRLDAGGASPVLDLGHGTWQCMPMDIPEGGYTDTSHFARGSWSAAPAPIR